MEVVHIDKSSSQKICSEQVIVDLPSCVKELTENAADAGATAVEICLVESGSQFIEVRDNGTGVLPRDFERIVNRHETSKIRSFEDIHANLQTLGFRGEALNSLCVMGEVTILTRHQSEVCGALLTYDAEGILISSKAQAREVGTTVTIRNLFSRFAVRRQEFMRNLRAQLTATVTLLQQYGIILGQVRFTLSNTTSVKDKKRTITLLSTPGQIHDFRSTCACVLGEKLVQDMVPLSIVSDQWSLTGLVSQPAGGRRSRDIQFFFINSRPIDAPKKLSRCLNAAYKQVSAKLYATCIIDIKVQRSNVDVNVSPDKRAVFCELEDYMATVLAAKLESTLCPSSLPQLTITAGNENSAQDGQRILGNGGSLQSVGRYNCSPTVASELGCCPGSCVNVFSDTPMSPREAAPSSWNSLSSPHARRATFLIDSGGDTLQRNVEPTSLTDAVKKRCTEEGASHVAKRKRPSGLEGAPSVQREPSEDISDENRKAELSPSEVTDAECVVECNLEGIFSLLCSQTESRVDKVVDEISIPSWLFLETEEKPSAQSGTINVEKSMFKQMSICGQFNKGFIICKLPHDQGCRHSLFIVDQHASDEKCRFEYLNATSRIRVQPLLRPLKIGLTPAQEQVVESHLEVLKKNGFLTFIDYSKSCGSRVHLKSIPCVDKIQMGQEDFLDLVDTVAECSEEGLSRPKTRKVSQMGTGNLLWEACGTLPRPSKLWAILASKACRSAIMIGDDLPDHKMRKLVCQLGSLEQPWNCPHGRPTVRHLMTCETELRQDANFSDNEPLRTF